MEKVKNLDNQSGQKKGNFSKFVPLLAGALFFANPNGASAQNNQTRTKAEVSTSTILDRLDQKLGVSLPDEFNQKVLDFVINDTIMRTRSATDYTENFILDIMKKNPGISEENRLLFNRSSIYGGISKKFLYDRLDDENEFRANEYEKVLTPINQAYEEYKKGRKVYMETKSAEYRQQSAKSREQSAKSREQSAIYDQQIAEYDQQISEYDKQSAEALNSSLDNLVRFYNRYKKDPSTIKTEEVSRRKEDGKRVIKRCKDLGIDYKAKLSPEMLKFYDVE